MSTVNYACLDCKENPKFEDPRAMFAHLREVHKLKSKPIKGTQKAVTFMDGSRWLAASYEQNYEGVKILKTVVVTYS